MAYIGKQPAKGNFVKLDTITTSATTTFNLTNGGVAYSPISANNCLVSLNGILQAPTDSYTISGSTIIFSSALTTSDVIDFIIVLGDVLSLGTVSDSTIGIAKFTATGTPSSSTFLRGDNSWASAGATAGQVIQVLGATDTTERSTTSGTFVTASNTLSVAITPASSSNKFAIFVNHYAGSSSGYGQYTIARGGTNLGGSEGMAQYNSGGGTLDGSVSYCYLDSPATTSSITYQAYMKAGSGTQKMGQANRTAQIIVMEIKG